MLSLLRILQRFQKRWLLCRSVSMPSFRSGCMTGTIRTTTIVMSLIFTASSRATRSRLGELLNSLQRHVIHSTTEVTLLQDGQWVGRSASGRVSSTETEHISSSLTSSARLEAQASGARAVLILTSLTLIRHSRSTVTSAALPVSLK